MWKWLKSIEKIHQNTKTIMRIMKNAIFYPRCVVKENGIKWALRFINIKIC